MNTPDNFDALWDSLKEQVKQARIGKVGPDELEERPLIYTDGDAGFQSKYGGIVAVNSGDEDGASLYVTTGRATISINCQPAALYAIAAQCIAAAQEVEEALAEAVRPEPATAA